jgi:macrodomain Ter protein organizer (MatP/YcbG family)
MWDHFKTAVKRIIDQRVPTKMTRARHTHPWMNTTIRRKTSQKHRAHEKQKYQSEQKFTLKKEVFLDVASSFADVLEIITQFYQKISNNLILTITIKIG